MTLNLFFELLSFLKHWQILQKFKIFKYFLKTVLKHESLSEKGGTLVGKIWDACQQNRNNGHTLRH